MLTVHHCALYTLASTPAVKLIENSVGESYNTHAVRRS